MHTKLFLILFFIAAFIERMLGTFRRREQGGEIYYEWVTKILIVNYFVIVFCSLVEMISFRGRMNDAFIVIGFICYIMGVILRRSAIKALGANWSVHTKIYQNHQLITTGPYKILRHPYYIAVLLELTGISLIYNSMMGIILTYCLQLPFLFYRIPKEDATLQKRFGDSYSAYKGGVLI